LTADRFSYLILPQAPSPPHTHHMPWLSALCHGRPTRRFVYTHIPLS
jgi:hypothetical protein